ncbi:putative BRCA2, oligonucleotide/oligosaccharide-binding, domain 1 [Lyophyllum shimeji]|uniref:BRCA2, oligonucleotide/oligosaccharide-binding, domain 1 n=1 Tax=Lyophyllum shimeji TaxID=47721 RepID=A0A9P3UIP4_LYOSH|nr:putative BRCA2, oligonucleotide/oligosaccharide-binding, domain 1 [Lyophyllum shimeji]
MRSPDSSPSSSPARKRQRLSSPTYDEQLGDLSQADIDALEEMEAQTFSSQSPTKNSSQLDVRGPRLQRSSSDDSEYASANTINLADDPDNPFTGEFTNTKNTTAAFPVTSPMPMPGFVSASNLHAGLNARSPSPEEPPNQDFDAWFGPAAAIPAVAFQTASTLSTVGTPITVGFSRASNKGFFQPSHASLAKAQAEMKEIWQDPIPASRNSMSGASTSATTTEDVENALRPPSEAALKSPARRPALHSVGNSFNSPEFNSPVTPSPLGFSRASAVQKNATSGLTPTELFISKNIKPFKSPLPMNRSTTANKDSPGSPLNATNRVGGFASARIQHPLASAPLTADPLPSTASTFSSITTPARRPRASNVGSSLKRGSPAPFVTPFKPGMKPGEPGRLQLEAPSQLKQPATPDNRKTDWLTQERPGDKAGRSGRTGVFDLTSPPNRRTLESSGLKPQQYTADQLESMGINHTELLQMTPKLAMYYSFHTPGDTPLYPLTSSPPVVLGPAQALDTLLDNGCTLATKPWVDNHWGLILWKLAGMVALDPQRESLPNQKRWCWAEVMRQLFYRYERELNCAKRPPLRLITARDAPAACPMVLCVSDVTWKSGSCTDDGTPLEPHPELEVTDGWYRLRAQVDAPLARAVRRGIIRIGRKIAVAGAYLSSERKDAAEVLEAYNSVKLVISGNSSHMAPWHAKLGFTSGPCISTLHSLTQDGGMVAGMDIVVVKAHPIAYLEFIEDESGLRTCQGPMSASEEAAAHEEWKQRWELEMSKLRAEMEKKWNRYEGYLERLERRAGVEEFRPSQDDFPLDVIENIYDELEDPAEAPNVLAGLGRNECGSLAHYIRDRLQKEKAHAAEELEAELKHICPPRNVRSFRIIVVQDSCTRRRPANRKALLTVWDVLNLSFCEGGSPGSFGIGQRFIVTNLKPTQPRSWMDDEPGSEVYLCTTQSSRWTT